jgi:adenosine kinase
LRGYLSCRSLYGLQQGYDWETIGQIASLLGTLKIERPGTQNHSFTMNEFKNRFAEAFGRALD